MKYKLISAETVPITLYMVPVTNGARVTYNHYLRLEPGVVYETDDLAQINYLKNKTTKVRYSETIERALKESGAEYNIEYCKSCGGRVKKIEYHNIEVVEDD